MIVFTHLSIKISKNDALCEVKQSSEGLSSLLRHLGQRGGGREAGFEISFS